MGEQEAPIRNFPAAQTTDALKPVFDHRRFAALAERSRDRRSRVVANVVHASTRPARRRMNPLKTADIPVDLR